MNDKIEQCKRDIETLEKKLAELLKISPVAVCKTKSSGDKRLILSTSGLEQALNTAKYGGEFRERIALRWNHRNKKWECGSGDVKFSIDMGTYHAVVDVEGFE